MIKMLILVAGRSPVDQGTEVFVHLYHFYSLIIQHNTRDEFTEVSLRLFGLFMNFVKGRFTPVHKVTQNWTVFRVVTAEGRHHNRIICDFDNVVPVVMTTRFICV